MQLAIQELQSCLTGAMHRARIHRSEGNPSAAGLDDAIAEEVRRAITVLTDLAEAATPPISDEYSGVGDPPNDC